MIKISVVIPCYNVEKYLTQCLDSILEQPLQEIEIICVDGGSADRTLVLLREYANKDKRVRILEQEKKNAGVARNYGLSVAKGEYVHFFDSDAWLERNIYKRWYAIAKVTDADVCICLHKQINIQSREERSYGIHPGKQIVIINSFQDKPKHFLRNAIIPMSKLCRRDFLLDNNIYFDDLLYANDIAFHYRAIINAERISSVNEHYFYYRINSPLTLSDNHRMQLMDCKIQAFKNTLTVVAHLDYSIKAITMDEGISNLIHFYRKTIGSEWEGNTKRELDHCMKAIDWFVFVDDLRLYYEMWSRYYLEVLEWDSPLDVLLQPNPLLLQLNNTFVFLFRKSRGLVRRIRSSIIFLIPRVRELVRNAKNMILRKESRWWDLNSEKRNRKIIVSLTSFPARIDLVHKGIKTLLNQTIKPDVVVLWLAKNQFPNGERELPEELLALKSNGLSIRWCEDIKSHKKLIPSLREFPDDIIVTADDDLYYAPNWLELMYKSYQQDEEVYVHCHRPTSIFPMEKEWHFLRGGYTYYPTPSFLHKVCTGSGALFPPNALHSDVLSTELAMELTPHNDDIFFSLQAVRNNTKIKVIEGALPDTHVIEGAEETPTLYTVNSDFGEGLEVKEFENMLLHYPELEDILQTEYASMTIKPWER